MSSPKRLLIGGVAAVVLIGMAASFKRPSPASMSTQSLSLIPASPTPPTPTPPPPPEPTPSSRSPPALPGVPHALFSQAHQITTCNGQISSANFRAFPNLDDSGLLGVVPYGDWVYLSGRVVYGDGVGWYEAIAPTLAPSPNSPQQGWIASCFISG
ncbi:hypothetical protein NDI52_33150 [Leptolyngbya sp. PL-A3]|uniref:hypothetical protein n=1 Tax=Leptolyngbya sp. PL-A3 TaxID=2933911 RepID=UPI003299544A